MDLVWTPLSREPLLDFSTIWTTLGASLMGIEGLQGRKRELGLVPRTTVEVTSYGSRRGLVGLGHEPRTTEARGQGSRLGEGVGVHPEMEVARWEPWDESLKTEGTEAGNVNNCACKRDRKLEGLGSGTGEV